MSIELANEVVPDAKEVFLLGECAGSFDTERLGSLSGANLIACERTNNELTD